MSFRISFIRIFLLVLLAVFGSFAITPPQTFRNSVFKSTFSGWHGGKTTGQSDQTQGKSRRYDLSANKFQVWIDALPAQRPSEYHRHLKGLFSYDSSTAPTNTLYYFPPPRDPPIASLCG